MSKLEKLIRNHKDFSTLKSKNLLNCVQDFFNINEEGVTLKNTHQLETTENIQLTNHIKGIYSYIYICVYIYFRYYISIQLIILSFKM